MNPSEDEANREGTAILPSQELVPELIEEKRTTPRRSAASTDISRQSHDHEGSAGLTVDPTPPPARGHDFGHSLEPALLHVTGERLHDISWFRTAWQRGGAATAYASWRTDDGDLPVVIKIPVGPREYKILTHHGTIDSPTPRVAAHGMEIGPFEMAWVIMERIPGEPLRSLAPTRELFERTLRTTATFYRHTMERWPIESHSEPWDWTALLAKARDAVMDNPIEYQREWTKALSRVHKHEAKLLGEWLARPINTWCHGDLHFANLMQRPEDSPWCAADENAVPGAVLMDFGEVRSGHWVEDAVYLERVNWANPDAPEDVHPVEMLAAARREVGLPTDEGSDLRLADLRRVLMAASVPAFLRYESSSAHLKATLVRLDQTLSRLL